MRLHLGVAVTEIGARARDARRRHDDPDPLRGLGRRHQAPPLAGAAGLPQGRGGRIDVQPDLTVDGAARRLRGRRRRQHPEPRRRARIPQLGSVALQSGAWAADNLLADLAGKPRKPFHYHDKGIMAMIGRGAAIAEVGPHRHELHGAIAFSAWLGVHAALMTGVRNRVDAFIDWGSDYFSEPPRAAGARPLRRRADRLGEDDAAPRAGAAP